jgi:hypothetical protein
MTTDNQTLPNTLITSTWGQQTNDRVIQVFATKADLPGVGASPWAPSIGSIAYTTGERGLWRFDGTNWETALARGYLKNTWLSTNVASRNDGVWTIAASLSIPNGVRQGCTYLINWTCNPYTPSNNISLWGGYIYITDPAAAPPLGAGVANVPSIATFGGGLNLHKAGGGWPGGAMSSVSQSGCAVWGPMPSAMPAADARWIVGTNTGSPPVSLADVMMSVVEVGGPY